MRRHRLPAQALYVPGLRGAVWGGKLVDGRYGRKRRGTFQGRLLFVLRDAHARVHSTSSAPSSSLPHARPCQVGIVVGRIAISVQAVILDIDIEFGASVSAGVGAQATAKAAAAAAAVAQVVEALLLLELVGVLEMGVVNRVARWVPGLAPMNFYWN